MNRKTSTSKEVREFVRRVYRMVGDYPYNTLSEYGKALRDAATLATSIHKELEETKRLLRSTARHDHGGTVERDRLREQRALAESEWLNLVHAERARADEIAAELESLREQIAAETEAHSKTKMHINAALEALELIRDGEWNRGRACIQARTYSEYAGIVVRNILTSINKGQIN